ncbi:protease complex subunit PrcB family protein [Desulfurivibrio dismutans]|uniref:protease complex subunit PrcB family protein n=1 Tax=Desulfurivibrio dismutans TaxID=1398908 RepID=UPI0023DAE921|nr:protease complex subunit PrcB family protein [Desulfurivibrio alkaliphilus]MDF1615317.1 protease complex subunit PrcB family protein [Desulfurivibrio alkaliphilus]
MKGGFALLAAMLLLAWSLGGCIADDDDNDDNDDPGDPVAFVLLTSGQTSGIDSERLTALSQQAAYNRLWQDHETAFVIPPEQPAVDFSQRMVVAAFLGQRDTDGYQVEVVEVREREHSLMVTVRFTIPDDDCPGTETTTQPYRLVTIPQTDKVVGFTTEVRESCP